MDDTDVALVRAVLADPLASVAQLARAVGVGDSAARKRIKKLREQGVLGEVAALPNAALLDTSYLVCLFDGIDMEAPFACEAVVGSSINHEGVVAPTCLADEVPDELVQRFGQPSRTFREASEPMTPPGATLSPLQWRILAAVVLDPLASDRKLAKALEIGPRTVRRHREAFRAGKQVRYEVELRSMRGGFVLFHLFVAGPAAHDAFVVAAVEQAVGGAWRVHNLDEPHGALLFCSARDLADAAGAPKAAMALAGIDHAELVVSRDGRYHRERLAAACRRAAS